MVGGNKGKFNSEMYGRNDVCTAEIEKLREGDVCHTIMILVRLILFDPPTCDTSHDYFVTMCK